MIVLLEKTLEVLLEGWNRQQSPLDNNNRYAIFNAGSSIVRLQTGIFIRSI